MPLLLLLALTQAPLPQVGDTVWLVRTIAAPAGRVVRVAPWNPEGAVEALGPGILVRRGDSLDVRYPAVGWLPGSHAVEVPGPVLVSPDVGHTWPMSPLPLHRVLTIDRYEGNIYSIHWPAADLACR